MFWRRKVGWGTKRRFRIFAKLSRINILQTYYLTDRRLSTGQPLLDTSFTVLKTNSLDFYWF